MWKRRSLALLLTLPLMLPSLALADSRPFPPDAKRGKMTPAWHPSIVIDGKTRTLSPAARIFNQDNMIEMPASLRGENLLVNYQEDSDGQILNVWILTREEASQRLPAGQTGRRLTAE
ncbi:hypothetical protein [Pseudoduganella aquatica]|uniref:hypothetical protein n=1 Tax=Pseudoduganella aquatica TaxID=2660641 RepID=UPI001E5BB8C1|nr:hypothetical protein [Pseudoduganella aquatica]